MMIVAVTINVLFSASFAYSDNSNSNEIVAINTTTEKGYETLDAAVLEANEGEEVEIQVAGTYLVDCFRSDFWVPNHITISANESLDQDNVILDGVCYDEEWKSDYPIFPAYYGVEFKNITLDVGNHYLHGFWTITQPVKFYDCTIKGWFWTSIDTYFYNCNFIQESRDYYCVYTYMGDILFDDCYFDAHGRFVNIFKEDCTNKTAITFNNCQFESREKQKSAINVKASDGWPLGEHLLKWNVVITGCSTIGDNFPTDNRLNSPLVMIDDGNSPDIEISVGDSSGNLTEIYPPPPEYYVLTVGEGRQLHTSLEADPTYETLIWNSLTPEVVQVSSTGYIDQVKSGFARVTATTSVTGIVAEFNISFPCFKFHMNGHGEQIDDIYTEPYDPTRQIKLKPEDPVAEGFIFEGWYTDEALTNLYTWDKIQTSNLDLYAKWTKVPSPSHTVTFYPRNGAPETSVQVSEGEKVDRPQDPTWDDSHVFLFWTDTIEDENSEPFNFDTEIYSDLDLYAVWTVTEVKVDVDVPVGKIVIGDESKLMCQDMATEIALALSEDVPKLPEGIILAGNPQEQKEAFDELVNVIQSYSIDLENNKLTIAITPYAKDKEKDVPSSEISGFQDICLPSVDIASQEGLSCVYDLGVKYKLEAINEEGITIDSTEVSLSEISKPINYELCDVTYNNSIWEGAIQVLRSHNLTFSDISSKCIIDRSNKKVCLLADKFSTYLVDVSPDLYVFYDYNYEGGQVDRIAYPYNSVISEIPVAVRENYVFSNWYTDKACTEYFDFSQPLVLQTKAYASWNEKPAPLPDNPEVEFSSASTGDILWPYLILSVLILFCDIIAIIKVRKYRKSI